MLKLRRIFENYEETRSFNEQVNLYRFVDCHISLTKPGKSGVVLEMARVDLELTTEYYRGRNLVERVRAGFSIYACAQDAAGLRRVLDQRELTAEILSL